MLFVESGNELQMLAYNWLRQRYSRKIEKRAGCIHCEADIKILRLDVILVTTVFREISEKNRLHVDIKQERNAMCEK